MASKAKTSKAAAPATSAPGRQKSIFRVATRKRNFTQIPNDTLRDKNLKLDARGLLALILSYPDDWEFSKELLYKAAGIGRDKADRILGDLEKAKYCKRHQLRNPDGTMGPWEYVFTEVPGCFDDGTPQPENPVADSGDDVAATGSAGSGSPVTGQPVAADPHPTNTIEDEYDNEHEERGAQARRAPDDDQPAKGKAKSRPRPKPKASVDNPPPLTTTNLFGQEVPEPYVPGEHLKLMDALNRGWEPDRSIPIRAGYSNEQVEEMVRSFKGKWLGENGKKGSTSWPITWARFVEAWFTGDRRKAERAQQRTFGRERVTLADAM